MMADILTASERSELMSRVKGRGNATTEQRLLKLFQAENITGWRRHLRIGPCVPDFVFSALHIAVFADGCFWHGCPRHYTRPKTNQQYWDTKVRANRARDERVGSRLRRSGWSVWRIRECQIKKGRLPSRLLLRLKMSGSPSSGEL